MALMDNAAADAVHFIVTVVAFTAYMRVWVGCDPDPVTKHISNKEYNITDTHTQCMLSNRCTH